MLSEIEFEKMDPNTWFNISRFATLIGGVLTVIGGFGLYHFGKIKENNNDKNNKELESKIQDAKTEAANANKKTKAIELKVAIAKKESAFAIKKTAELELQLEQAKLEVEKAKIERQRLLDQQKFIKSINFEITLEIPTIDLEIQTNRHSTTAKEYQANPTSIAQLNGRGILFYLSSWTEQQTKKNTKQLRLQYNSPKFPNTIFGKPLDLLGKHAYIECICNFLLKEYKEVYDTNKIISSNVKIWVNGIEALDANGFEKESGEIMEDRLRIIDVNGFQKIPDIVLGNKRKSN